ncbi:hypothetical protein PBI_CAMILLE_22 [Microbacterium phage Camille]|nr:hypothetical protein PBI_CAMILLE_22 [Microbacterium phage Camille]
MRFALVRDGIVENVIVWDGEETYEPEDGYILYEVPEEVSPGWALIENQWTPPMREEWPIPDEYILVEQAKQQALLELTALGVSEATARVIVGLPPLETQE